MIVNDKKCIINLGFDSGHEVQKTGNKVLIR
jgi:hypothetical protein